jgi:hypothetical protein
MNRSLGLTVLVTALTGVPLACPGAEAGRMVNVSMEDQFRSRHATSQMRGHVVVLVYAERHGAEASRNLGRQLHVRFHPQAEKVPPQESASQPVTTPEGWPSGVDVPDVRVIAVACLSEIPRPFHGIARSRFRSDSPHLPVWLDFDDTMKRNFGLVGGVPNVAILDTQGRLHAVHNGRFDGDTLEELAVAIDALRLSVAQPETAALPDSPVVR